MKLFISTFGRTRILEATYSRVYGEKVRLINYVAKINRRAEALLRTVSVLISARTLLMVNVE
jgi:hypothetical protein